MSLEQFLGMAIVVAAAFLGMIRITLKEWWELAIWNVSMVLLFYAIIKLIGGCS